MNIVLVWEYCQGTFLRVSVQGLSAFEIICRSGGWRLRSQRRWRIRGGGLARDPRSLRASARERLARVLSSSCARPNVACAISSWYSTGRREAWPWIEERLPFVLLFFKDHSFVCASFRLSVFSFIACRASRLNTSTIALGVRLIAVKSVLSIITTQRFVSVITLLA